MVKHKTMERMMHTWQRRRKGASGRFFLGLLGALSITLVAFEWGVTRRLMAFPPSELPDEDLLELPAVVIIERKAEPERARPKPKPRGSNVQPGDPDDARDNDPDPAPVDGPAGDEGADTIVPPDQLRGDEGVANATLPWDLVGKRPYFMDCLKRRPDALDECTEARIEAHFTRQFRVPEGPRGVVRTMVFFEIDTEGRVGRPVCSPRVDAAIEHEVARVLAALPRFVPGTQGGIPVKVRYHIPLRVERR